MAIPMKRSFDEGEDVEGALNQIEDKSDEGSRDDESENEEGSDEGSRDGESEDEHEGSFHESEDEDTKNFFRATWDIDLLFSEESGRRYDDATKDLLLRYHREMRDTEGFGVTCHPHTYMIGGVIPLGLKNPESSTYQMVESCARYAVDRYNQKKNETIEFHKLEKATSRRCGGFMFYITFTALNSKTYETKVFYYKDRPYSVELFRLKKSPQV